jgi:hypothetical protein
MIFTKNDFSTGMRLNLLPIYPQKLVLGEKQKRQLSLHAPIGGYEFERALVQYAAFANYFAGNYDIFFERKDHGTSPKLVPVGPSVHTISGDLVLPREVSGLHKNVSGVYAPTKTDWEISNDKEFLLFCAIPYRNERLFARIHLKSERTLLENLIASSKNGMTAREQYTIKLQDFFIQQIGDVDHKELVPWD